VSRYRVIDSDAMAATAVALEPDETEVRVGEPLTEASHRQIAELLANRPDAWLDLRDRGPDLQALRHYPGLRRLGVTNLRLESWDGLRHVASTLEELWMGDTTLRPISIAPMGDLRSLRTLGLIGPIRDVEAIARLVGVEELSLRSIRMSDLAMVTPMSRLRSLWIGLSGPNDLSRLPELHALEELELWRIRGLDDVSALGQTRNLQRITLQSMSGITSLPSLRDATSLQRLALESMRGITNLAPIADAPALEELLLIGMNHLQPEALRPLVGHPTLRRGIWGLGSTRRNVAAYDLLPLGDPPYGHPAWRVQGAG
jgi:Leucine-rich repeat (LRR) protein